MDYPLAGQTHLNVAQLGNLLCRGLAIRRAQRLNGAAGFPKALPNSIRRYSTVPLCATKSNSTLTARIPLDLDALALYPLEHTIDETQKIVIRRIRAISLLKLVAAGVFTVFIPMFVFFGFLALVGFQTVHVNGRAVTGVGGLFAAIVMAPIFSFIFTIGVWVMLYIGIRLWGYFKPFTVGYVPANKPKVQT